MVPVDARPRNDILDQLDVVLDAGHSADDAFPRPPLTRRSTSADTDPPGYTLMVAGRRSGKTSFLRLLLDTSVLTAAAVAKDQLAAVARFVHASCGHTSLIRTVSIDVDLAPDDAQPPQPLTLTLIDTPSLDFDDDLASEATVSDILRHLDSRFAESIHDERKATRGDHHVHLCIYFLDPDSIVPPSVSAPAPVVPRARTNSISRPEQELVILEPPVTSDPSFCRPILPSADIATIRRLSARVNVLPVLSRADLLTNDRLNAVKLAIRKDLAEAGIGFGIFDVNAVPYSAEITVPKLPPGPLGIHSKHTNGTSVAASSPPSAPVSPSYPRLPFALISPDIYSHSDGVTRPVPSRHELVRQYTLSTQYTTPSNQPRSKISAGQFVRNYRWGFLDIMDVNHCDFLHLRGAIFHHMQTLQKHTRQYLFERFRLDQASATSQTLPLAQLSPATTSRLTPQSQVSRPVLAIDTVSRSATNRHPSLSMPRSSVAHNGDIALPHAVPSQTAAVLPEMSPKTASSSRSQRIRTKKITVACNFCRSRKLKCDGGRPACGQCFKRSNPCDYTSNGKRRGNNNKRRKHLGGSESEGGSAEDRPSGDPSGSPDVASTPNSRRGSKVSNVGMLLNETLPPLGAERRDESAVLPPIKRTVTGRVEVTAVEPRAVPTHADLPSIATLPTATYVPSVRSIPENHLASRKRASSAMPGKGGRQSSGTGSKIVACNFCRARKTRCDGVHPTCGSCSRRTLSCSYVNDPNSKARIKTEGRTPSDPSASTSSRSSPSASMQQSSGRSNATSGYVRHVGAADSPDLDMPPSKRVRMGSGASASAVVE